MYDQNTFPDFLFIDQSVNSTDLDSIERKKLNKHSGDKNNHNSFTVSNSNSNSNSQLLNSQNDISNSSNFVSQLNILSDINIDDILPNFVDSVDFPQLDIDDYFDIQSNNDNQLSGGLNSNSSFLIQQNISSNESNETNISFQINQNLDIEKKSRRKINLSSDSQLFKTGFYKVFTNKKRFPKNLVKEIHDFIHDSLNLPKMKRDHIRSIDLYFKEFSQFSHIILSFLQVHKDKIINHIPELSHLD